MDTVVVDAINLKSRVASREDGAIGRVVKMLDDEGDETTNTDDAVSAIVEWGDGTWSPVSLNTFDWDQPSALQ